MVSLYILRRKRQRKPGNPVFFCTLKFQERLTLGYAAAKSVKRTLDSCGAHATSARAVVSLSKMLSVICLEEIHLCEGCMHLMVYLSRSRQMAEVRSSQSQLHSVNGRSGSGDQIILPVSSMSEVLGIKTVLLSSKIFRNGTSFQQILMSVEKELGAQPTGAIRNSIGTSCRIFHQRNEFIKLGTTNGLTDIVRSFLNIPQDTRALDADLINGSPILAKPSS